MEHRDLSIARILVLIPIAVFVITAVCMLLAVILEAPSDRGIVYSVFAFIGIVSIFLSPLPCLVMSAAGTVFALKAVRAGILQARKYLAIGMIEILIHAGGLFLAIMMFIAGQGV